MDMDFTIELFMYAFEKNKENELLRMWELQFPNMDKDSFISFENYKEKQFKNIKTNTCKLSIKEMEKEMNMVENAFSERR